MGGGERTEGGGVNEREVVGETGRVGDKERERE